MSTTVTGLSTSDMTQLRKGALALINRYDTNRNGKIDNGEGGPQFRKHDYDTYSSRDVWTGDFVTVTTVNYDVFSSLSASDLQLADKNKDGVDADELVNEVLTRADKNGNGKLDKGFLGLFGNETHNAHADDLDRIFERESRKETGRSSYTYYDPQPKYDPSSNRPTPPPVGGSGWRPTPPPVGGGSRPTPPPISGGTGRPTPPPAY